MERFESRERQRGPEINEERVADISEAILESQECVDFLLKKIQQKIDYKKQVIKDDGSNTPSEWKRLGIFIVHEQRLPQELVNILDRKGVEIDSTDALELHVPPQDADIGDANKSFERLREYLSANQESGKVPRFIYGVSYLAKLAKHWGFTVVNLPVNIQEKSGAANVLRSYAATEKDLKKQKIAERYATRDISLCFITVEDLLKK